MGARLSGRTLRVRGVAPFGGNPRVPPRRANSRSQRSTSQPEVLSRPDVTVKPQTLFEILGGTSENPAPSKFGGTTLERVVDNAAARLGFEFDQDQWIVQLPMTGSYTVIDRVRFHPRVAVYIDGIQHDLRADAEAQDFLQKLALEHLGWKVIRLNWKDLKRDPIGTVRGVLYVI
jgi:very-short-patch-repair endonuclease